MIERFGPLVKTLRFWTNNGYFNGLYSNGLYTEKCMSVFRKPSSIYDVFTLLQGKLTVI